MELQSRACHTVTQALSRVSKVANVYAEKAERLGFLSVFTLS